MGVPEIPYPGSELGPLPEDDPEFFARWYFKLITLLLGTKPTCLCLLNFIINKFYLSMKIIGDPQNQINRK
jgi:hypothetical protein